MSPSTTRATTPAATPRTGRGESALPRPDLGAKTQPLPFAALPHELRKDPRLKANRTAIVLAAALLEYARAKPSCYPTNARLAADLGCCAQTIRNALAALQAAGWIRIEWGANQPNGRRIWLTWRCNQPMQIPHLSDTLQPVGPPLQPVGLPLKPVEPKGRIVVIEEENRERNVTTVPLREELDLCHVARTMAPVVEYPQLPSLQAHVQAPILTAPTTSVRPLQDELKNLPRADQCQVRVVAWRLAHFLMDPDSIGFFITVLAQVVAGVTSVERLLAAFQAGVKAKGRAQKPGAIFAWTWKNWTPPPKPSEINRPKYSQALSSAVRASSSSMVDQSPEAPLSREEEIVELKSWLAQPRHPFAAHAQRRLVELGVEIGS